MSKKIWILTFLTLFMLPLLSLLLRVQGEELGGVSASEKQVEVNLANLWSGTYQQKFENKFKRTLPIWPVLVRSDNQLNFSIFRQISGGYKQTVVLGKDNQLIERAYLRSASHIKVPQNSRISERAEALKNLQDAFKKLGIPVLLLLSPNKPSLYPEFIEEQWKIEGSENRSSAYQLFIEALVKAKVQFVDGRRLLEQQKQYSKYPFFAKSGTHWNELGSCLVASEMISTLSTLAEKRFANFNCEPTLEVDFPSYADRDLSRVVNLWFPEQTYASVQRPAGRKFEGKRPKLVFVGTSFLWAILEHLHKFEAYERLTMLYYFKRRYSFPGATTTRLVDRPVDWEKEIFGADAIVLEINEAFPHKVGYGFIAEALKQISERKD